MKISFVSLGCAKNLVDSEYILGLLRQDNNITIIDDISLSDAIFVNTCGFITDAKKEAINTIFDVINNKRKDAYLIVIGCLAKRYKKELQEQIPEIDLICGVDEYDNIGEKLNVLLHTKLPSTYDMLKRSLTNPLPTAYLKIGEGCKNRCAFCAIPLIRGNYHSYDKNIIIEDAKRLISLGKKEIVIIAQDPTQYGYDLYKDYHIEDLLEDLLALDNNTFYRVLYLYPDRISDRLINIFKNNKNLLPYFDLPMQHSSNHVLALMKRSGTKEKYLEVINKIRSNIDNAILRTTLITGFPGETIEDHEDLVNFVKEIRFDHLGVFTFSKEEGTASYNMKDQVPLKRARFEHKQIMEKEKDISFELNTKRIGQIHDVLIEDFDGKNYIGRSYIFAPDAEDGYFYIKSNKELIIGNIYKVKITKAKPYDLIGEIADGTDFKIR